MANGTFIKPDILNWERAYKRVLKNSQSDFVPLRFDYWLLDQNPKGFIERAQKVLRDGRYNPSPLKIIEVPKSDLTTRPAAIAELDDRIIYQALVDSIAEIVEPQIQDVVFSHRLLSDANSIQMFREYDESYGAFLKKQKEVCESNQFEYISICDIASYYERIYHHRLIQLLDGFGCSCPLVSTLGHLLREWNNGDSHGIPQGFWASDYLGNIYLHEVDVFMTMKGYRYLRYVDDIVVFCNSENEGRIILLNLGKKLRLLGLGLNAKKIDIKPVSEYLPNLDTATERVNNAMQEMFNSVHFKLNPYFDEFSEEDISSIAQEINVLSVHKVFDETAQSYPLNETMLKVCLKLLAGLEDPYATEFVLNNLSILPHLSSYFGNYLCKCPYDDNVERRLIGFLKSENNIYNWQTMWLIRYLGRQAIGNKIRSLLRKILDERNNDEALRALSAFILGNKGDVTDQRLIKDSYDSESSTLIKRGIICGLKPMPKAERNHFLKYHKHDSWSLKIACETIEKN
jgi:hypothetical protein